jgi:hypothetical protein
MGYILKHLRLIVVLRLHSCEIIYVSHISDRKKNERRLFEYKRFENDLKPNLLVVLCFPMTNHEYLLIKPCQSLLVGIRLEKVLIFLCLMNLLIFQILDKLINLFLDSRSIREEFVGI